ncbi:MAG TPA: hypothetical protein VHP32_09315 [Ignavibacteria bacterium]|nr:hypothetical protein [Ignavibacteria bacterium]
MKHLNEELLYSLPDYINDQIKDQKLISEIEMEINNNPGFKLEYENLRNTFLFLNKTQFEEPSEAYFNNLLPNIHAKIDAKKDKKKFNILDYLSPTLKYVLPVICIMFVVYIYTKDATVEQVAVINQPETTIVNENTTANNIQGDSNASTNQSAENTNESITKNQTETSQIQIENIPVETISQIETDIIATDNAFTTEDDIYDIQYEGLSDEDEEQILNSLKNSDL